MLEIYRDSDPSVAGSAVRGMDKGGIMAETMKRVFKALTVICENFWLWLL